MKISMFTNTYLPHVGGVARSVSTFAEDLRNLGHHVQIIAPTFPELDESDSAEEHVVRVPAIQNFNGSDFSVRIPLPGLIHEAIEDFKPEIIHSHHPFLLGEAALRIARFEKLPLVFTHHTLYEQYTHYVPLDSPALKRFVIELATGYANLCNQVIAPSTSVKKLLLKRGVQSSVEVLPTGIDIDFFSQGNGRRFRSRHKIPEDMRVLGHVGRLAREKNLPYLARCAAAALKEIDDACFLVAGTGDAEKEIKEIFIHNGLQDRLVMAGSLTGQDLADCYGAMDLFVFASLSETQGLVLAEAMASATPVIALEASGVADVLKNGVNGAMLKAETNEDTFAAVLVESLKNRKKMIFWQDKARQTAHKFSRRSCAKRLLETYRNTISKKRTPFITEIEILDAPLTALKTEWDLLQEKASAAFSSISKTQIP